MYKSKINIMSEKAQENTDWALAPKENDTTCPPPPEPKNFGEALEALKKGKKVCRIGWNGSNMFAVLSPGSSKPLKTEDWFSPAMREYTKDGRELNVRPSLLLKTAQEDVAYWIPSGSDILAEDWIILD